MSLVNPKLCSQILRMFAFLPKKHIEVCMHFAKLHPIVIITKNLNEKCRNILYSYETNLYLEWLKNPAVSSPLSTGVCITEEKVIMLAVAVWYSLILFFVLWCWPNFYWWYNDEPLISLSMGRREQVTEIALSTRYSSEEFNKTDEKLVSRQQNWCSTMNNLITGPKSKRAYGVNFNVK